MPAKQDECLCGYKGRQDNVLYHRKRCKGAKKIEAILQNEIRLQNENSILRKLCKTNPSDNIINIQTSEELMTKKHELEERESKLIEAEQTQNDKQGFLYILRTRESVRLDEPVYKVGKTYDMEQRFKQYPKGSELLKSIKVCERHIAEKVLLREFSSKFKTREEFGNEYFEGDLQEMLVIFEEFSRIFV